MPCPSSCCFDAWVPALHAYVARTTHSMTEVYPPPSLDAAAELITRRSRHLFTYNLPALYGCVVGARAWLVSVGSSLLRPVTRLFWAVAHRGRIVLRMMVGIHQSSHTLSQNLLHLPITEGHRHRFAFVHVMIFQHFCDVRFLGDCVIRIFWIRCDGLF